MIKGQPPSLSVLFLIFFYFFSVCFLLCGHQRHVSLCSGTMCVLFLLTSGTWISSSVSFRFPVSHTCVFLIKVQTLNEQEWERMQQANVLANVAQAFESDMDASDLEEDRETIFSSVDLLSPAGQADAQTLALMLQEQLDAINNEIRYQK